ncbi:MAG: ABC transporter permease [Acidimicrobiia bacterium]|nr:ABC transporter permease [Acidimicrobiia bacterium]
MVIPLLAVVLGLAIGAVIIWVTAGAGQIAPAYGALFSGSVGGIRPIADTLFNATPLILAGLSVAIGFKAGLFNIGAEGQMIVGGTLAVLVGFSVTGLPALVHIPLALLAGFIGGAVWGGIPGYLLARTGAHEVITTIMLNFVAAQGLAYMLRQPWMLPEGRIDPISKPVEASARLPRILDWLPFEGASGIRLHLGFLLAIAAAFVVYWLLFKSTLGFEFRAVGSNPKAAAYGGMSVTKATVLSMAIAGGLGGLAGANETLGLLGSASNGFAAGAGFDAIAVALLGRSHPIGVVLAGLLFGALRAGGRAMQVQSEVGVDLIVIVQALIIIFIAAPELVRAVFRVRGGRRTGQVARGWAK